MPVLNNILAGAAGSAGGADADFKIERSLRFQKQDTAHLSKTFSVGNRRTWTWSGWAKLATLSAGRNLWACYNGTYNIDDFIQFYIGNDSTFLVYVGSSVAWKSTEVFRDPSAWYHFVISFDSTRSNADDILKVYVNNQQLSKASGAGFSLNTNYAINNNIPHRIGTYNGASEMYDGYMTEIHFVDGQALAPTDFGEVDDNGVWQPKEPTFTSPNDGTTWSSSLSTAAGFNRPATNVFDGDIFSTANTPNNTGGVYTGETNAFEFIPSSSIPFTSSVKVTGRGTGQTTAKAKIDTGSGYGSEINLSGDGIETVISGSGNLVKLKVWTVTYSGENELGAILIDDVPLVDGVGKYGTNGYNLNFSNNSATYKLGKDAVSTDTPLPCVDFDGDDHLQVAYSSDFDLANNDFTIECYARTTDASTNYPSIVGKWESSSASDFDFRPASDDANHNFFFIYRTGGNNITVNSGASITDGKWHHIAVARESSNLRMFVDGVLVHTHNIGTSTIQNTNMPLYLGYDPYGTSYYTGQTSNLRIVVGTALYTAAFTKPTTPLTNVTNTKLLCFQSDTSVTTAAVTPNALTVQSGDPEARSVSDSDWTVNNISAGFTPGKLYKSSTLYLTKSNILSNATLIEGGSSLSSEYLYFVPSGSETTGSPVFDGGGYESNTNNMDLYWHDGSSWNNVQGSYWDEEATLMTWGTDTTVYQLQSNRDFYVIGGNIGGSSPDAWTGSAPSVSSGGKHIDSMLDSPTNYDDGTNIGGNYATLSSVDNPDGFTLSNGNLETTINGSTGNSAASSIVMTTGKWYWENTITWNGNDGGATGIIRGGDTNPAYNSSNSGVHVGATIFSVDGTITGSQTPSWARHDIPFVIGHALDLDNGNIKFYLNNQLWKTVTLPASTTGWKAHSNYGSSGGSMTCVYNFGARGSFAFTPPTGYKALCTQNLDNPLIVNPSTAFDAKTYDGNGGTQTISGLGFRPDLVWVKRRNAAVDHILFDSVRGFGANKELVSNDTYTEGATGTGNPNTDVWGYVDSVTDDGFVVEKGSNSTGSVANTTGGEYIGWVWDAGTSFSNNAGSNGASIASSGAVNQSAGFSIVSYTGNDASSATVAHGLNAKPEFMIIKNRDTSGHDWVVYHQALGATKRLDLNSAGGPSTATAQFNDTEPTSSVFTIGTYENINTTDQYIAYVFAPVEGFSAFGGPYTGTGTTSGPFQYCGFKPRWIMIKPFVIGSSANGSNWVIFDTARSTYNETGEWLRANDNADEYVGTQDQIDILSNGFKLRQGNTQTNHQSNEYIWIAFAEDPFKYARAR